MRHKGDLWQGAVGHRTISKQHWRGAKAHGTLLGLGGCKKGAPLSTHASPFRPWRLLVATYKSALYNLDAMIEYSKWEKDDHFYFIRGFEKTMRQGRSWVYLLVKHLLK